MKEIKIFNTTDVHAYPYSNDINEGGVTTLFKLKKDNPNAILIDNGDFFIGSILSTYFSNKYDISPMVKLANDLQYDVMIAGNHDFDYGLNYLKKQVKHLNAKYLCCNAFDLNDNLIFEPYAIIDRDGIKVGVIGALTSAMPQISDLKLLDNVYFKDAIENIKINIDKIKDNVDYLVIAYHGGNESDMLKGYPTQYDTGEDQAYKILNTFNEIDALIFGHQHRNNFGVKNNIAFTQSGYRANFIGEITLKKDYIHANLIDTKHLETKDIFKDEFLDLEKWLNEDYNLNQFNTWINENLNSFIDIKINGNKKIDFKNSFKIPYTLSEYLLTKEELLKLYKENNLEIKGITIKENEIIPNHKYYKITTNRQNIYPSYKKTHDYITPVFDKAFGVIDK